MTNYEFQKIVLKMLIQFNDNFTEEQKEVLKYIVDETYKRQFPFYKIENDEKKLF